MRIVRQQLASPQWLFRTVLWIALLVPALCGRAGAGAAVLPPAVATVRPAAPSVPPGVDEAEYERLRRPFAPRALPDVLTPEMLRGLGAEVVEALRQDFAERGRILIQSEEYLDYDEERDVIYSSARTRIWFDRYLLEADRVLVQVPLQEIQAEGNVILRAWRDPGLTQMMAEIHAESLVFNYRYFEGAAGKVRGQYDVLYFKAATDPDAPPAFQMIGRDEIHLRNVQFTTSNFPDPEYAIRTRDAVIVFDDRLFMQGATLYVRHIPILWLPAYTRSLRERFPWHVTFGRGSRLGTYLNINYNFWHSRYEPSFDDPDDLEVRNSGHAVARLDLFSERGPGIGFQYEYGFNFDQHRGRLSLYGLPSDRRRQHDVEEDANRARWQAFAEHRSQLSPSLILNLNLDYMSDPEIYDDVLDYFEPQSRRRVPERRARAALTWWKRDYIGRVLFEAKERISRDRIANTFEPTDDDLDYDLDPFDEDFNEDDEGLPPDRYGLATARMPHLTFGTRHLRLGGGAPLFYSADLDAFHNLDKGLNFNNSKDDSFVLGLDFYQQLSYLFKFSERYTLLAQVGAGIGAMRRLDDSFGWAPEDFLNEDGTPRTDIFFVDEDTFRTAGGREVSISDYNPAFFYGDLKLRFQGRFTDSLTGNLYYILREGNDDSLIEWYESVGNRTAREDLYDARIRQHWITADLRHILIRPEIQTILAAGRNLQSQSDIYSNELIQFAMIGSEYRNRARTVRLSGYARYDQYQLRDPSDPFEYQRDSVTAGVGAGYAPVHRRWWIESDLFVWKALNSDPAAGDVELDIDVVEDRTDSDFFFQENDTDIILDTWIGRRIGEKYTVELGAEYQEFYQGIRNARLILSRDLHSAVAQFQARYRRRPWKDTPTEIDVRFSFLFKLPGPMETVWAPRPRTLMVERRELELAEDPRGI